MIPFEGAPCWRRSGVFLCSVTSFSWFFRLLPGDCPPLPVSLVHGYSSRHLLLPFLLSSNFSFGPLPQSARLFFQLTSWLGDTCSPFESLPLLPCCIHRAFECHPPPSPFFSLQRFFNFFLCGLNSLCPPFFFLAVPYEKFSNPAFFFGRAFFGGGFPNLSPRKCRSRSFPHLLSSRLVRHPSPPLVYEGRAPCGRHQEFFLLPSASSSSPFASPFSQRVIFPPLASNRCLLGEEFPFSLTRPSFFLDALPPFAQLAFSPSSWLQWKAPSPKEGFGPLCPLPFRKSLPPSLPPKLTSFLSHSVIVSKLLVRIAVFFPPDGFPLPSLYSYFPIFPKAEPCYP